MIIGSILGGPIVPCRSLARTTRDTTPPSPTGVLREKDAEQEKVKFPLF
jgi:hypothetical protein